MAALVPDEILETILLKLPIKSLCRFKSVSKSWNSMISDPRFIRTQYELSMAKSENSLFVKHDEDGWFSFVRLEGRQLKTQARVWMPLALRGDTAWRWLLGIGDGFILLNFDRSCYPMAYILWNPQTRQQTIFRFPYDNISLHYSFNMYGVCYDPKNEDVKVVIASKGFYTVNSCKNRSWAEKKEFPCRIVAERFDPGLSVDGAIYWICHKKDRSKIILCFDSKDDSFKILQKLEKLADDEWLQLKARKGRLYLCCYGKYGKTVKIWIKENEGCSWKLLVNIDNLDNGTISPTVVAPLTENEMIIRMTIRLDWRRYYIYNCCDKSYQEIQVNPNSWGSLHPFLGSMFKW